MAKPAVVSDNTFQQEVINASNEQPVLVDFWATWCGPCKMLSPTLEQIADEKIGKLKVVKMDVDDNPEVASKFGILSIPTMILFKNGKPAAQLVGNQPKARILSQIDPLLS
ncbi:MAG: thioredoxin [Chloroflexi bacterium]|uniref:Thioredoxin n=1 Tax=Candidatus Chlorohelix allophototropha TaxID=3003348 RepID=A0A8T7M7H5_9CHLR|nr:thioredoxin [Chloroflexota bacterium]WJW69938.1 thioredoxin [Chloroflexota bacterium L227-S17]